MSAPTFFEGPEKKVELAVKASHPPLRSLGDAFWHAVVEASDAQVLSKVEGPVCDAYLLSESSLFVYDGFLTMITCGQTRLVSAVARIVEEVGADQVALLMYERKNEHFPDRQHSSFYDDARRLQALVPGQALRFGDEHDHHVHLFYSSADYVADAEDTTLEILMHGLDRRVSEQFIGCAAPKGQTIAGSHGLEALLPGFTIDEHAFTPAGYSMNGVRGEDYYTIHVTPEQLGSYVSFETNLDFRKDFSGLVQGVVDIFRPGSFDVMAFVPGDGVGSADSAAAELATLALPGFCRKDHAMAHVHGYDIRFWHFFQPSDRPKAAFPIRLALS